MRETSRKRGYIAQKCRSNPGFYGVSPISLVVYLQRKFLLPVANDVVSAMG